MVLLLKSVWGSRCLGREVELGRKSGSEHKTTVASPNKKQASRCSKALLPLRSQRCCSRNSMQKILVSSISWKMGSGEGDMHTGFETMTSCRAPARSPAFNFTNTAAQRAQTHALRSKRGTFSVEWHLTEDQKNWVQLEACPSLLRIHFPHM